MVKLLDEMSPHTGSVLPNAPLARFALSKQSGSQSTAGGQARFWVPAALNWRRFPGDARSLRRFPLSFAVFPFLSLPYVTSKKVKIWNIHLKWQFEACVKSDYKEETAYPE